MKVFISSTYVDLIEHRKAAHDVLEQLGGMSLGCSSLACALLTQYNLITQD